MIESNTEKKKKGKVKKKLISYPILMRWKTMHVGNHGAVVLFLDKNTGITLVPDDDGSTRKVGIYNYKGERALADAHDNHWEPLPHDERVSLSNS